MKQLIKKQHETVKSYLTQLQDNNWKKQWDKMFKKTLGDENNEWVKFQIDILLNKQKKYLIANHNLIAIAYEKSEIMKSQKNNAIEHIKKTIKDLEQTKKDAQEIIKILKKI